MTDLYLVSAKSEEGNSLDLIVEAHDGTEAFCLWRGWVTEFGGQDRPAHVYRLPKPIGRPGIKPWHAGEQCVKQIL